ncbi:MAG: AI-2E family transporter [Anaerolineae bacterium]|nr:AI-2E family transporter [Anaerolineae bacterium]
MKVSVQSRIFFYILLVVVFWVTYILLKPYLGVVVFSVITVVIFKPVYDLILRCVGGHKGLATTLTIIGVLLAVLVPALIVINITLNQASLLVQDVSSFVSGHNTNFGVIIDRINEIIVLVPFAEDYQISEESIRQALRNIAGPVTNFVANQAISLGGASVEWITDVIIFLTIVGTLFPTYEKAAQLIKDLSPLPDELDQIYLSRFVAMTKAMFKGIIVIAVIQGVIAGVFMAVAGTWYVFFLTLLAIFVAVLPMGVNALTIPVGIVHFLLGNTWQGIVIIAGSLLVVSQLDNLVRPKLVSRDAYLNPALVLLSAFGGLVWFGFLGVIYGPIIAIFFVTTLEIYLKYYRISAPAAMAVPLKKKFKQNKWKRAARG